jgi:hypothetical protein
MPAILPILLSIISNRVGQIVAAFIVGGVIGWWHTSSSWRTYEAAQAAAREAAYQVELAREQSNAQEIAKAATQRAEDDAADLAKLHQAVVDFTKDEAHAKDPCLMDDRFLDAAGKLQQPRRAVRPARVTRPSR